MMGLCTTIKWNALYDRACERYGLGGGESGCEIEGAIRRGLCPREGDDIGLHQIRRLSAFAAKPIKKDHQCKTTQSRS